MRIACLVRVASLALLPAFAGMAFGAQGNNDGLTLPDGFSAVVVQEGAIRQEHCRAEEPSPRERRLSARRTRGRGMTGRLLAWVGVALAAGTAGAQQAPPTFQLAWVDRQGNETAISGVPSLFFIAPRLSPQDDRVVLTGNDDEGSAARLWDFAGLTKLTAYRELNRSPIWSPDGKDVAYSVQRDGKEEVYWQLWVTRRVPSGENAIGIAPRADP